MPFYQVMLSGRGINLPIEGSSEPAIGFFITRIVRASTFADAEHAAKQVIGSEWQSPRFASNQGGQPSLTLESSSPVGLLKGLFSRPIGYSFFSAE